MHLEFKSVWSVEGGVMQQKKAFFFWFMVLACWITSPCAADKRITGASLPRRSKRRPLSAYLVVMKQGIQHQQVKGANRNLPYGLTSLWWGNSLELLQLCDIFNCNNSGSLQGFRLKLITGCFAYTHYASRMARSPLNKVCYKEKKKNDPHFPFAAGICDVT